MVLFTLRTIWQARIIRHQVRQRSGGENPLLLLKAWWLDDIGLDARESPLQLR